MPMPTNKVKLSDFAADLAVPAEELIEQLKKIDAKTKKPTASLTDAEMNYLLEYYTQSRQVESFEAFFAAKAEKEATAAAKPAKPAKPEARPQKRKAEKTDAPAKSDFLPDFGTFELFKLL